MPAGRIIETGVDKLVMLVAQKKRISVKDAARELGVSVANIEEWADFLEDEGLIKVETKLATIFLVEQKLSKSQLANKMKECQADKDLFIRKVSSAAAGVDGDAREIKKIAAEFDDLRGLVADNFKKLSSQLDSIEHFRSSHKDLDEQRAKLEKEYNEKISALENKIDKDKGIYDDLLKEVCDESKELEAEKTHLGDLEKAGDNLHTKLQEFMKIVTKVSDMMKEQEEKIHISEGHIKKSEELAKSLKGHVEEGRGEIDELKKKLDKSRVDLDAMEKDFLANVDRLSKGKFSEIEAYKQSKEAIEKFKNFFEKSKELTKVIEDAEKEEEEVKRHFEKFVKKSKAVSSALNVCDPTTVKELETELKEIQNSRKEFRSKVDRLKSSVRSIFT